MKDTGQGRPKTGLPIELTKFIQELLNIDIFIETGTGFGITAEIASDIFKNVYTIEAHKGRYQKVKAKFSDTNVTCIFGESPQALKDIITPQQSVIFLDAHCYYREAVTDNVCPLLDEIKVVVNSNPQHIIIIDDVDTFAYCPVRSMFPRDSYPELIEIIDVVRPHNPYIIIVGKSIVIMPRSIKKDVDDFLMNEGNKDD